jgi:serine/threonine protein kinase
LDTYIRILTAFLEHRTHAADISRNTRGQKQINQYEIIDEIGRGVHGKVKRGRNTETGEEVAIKIVERFPRRRRFGKAEPESKVKQEIAILKKCRHPNVVSLLEVIDDVEINKVYLVLELLRPGEIIWRVKAPPLIRKYERDRVERAEKMLRHGVQDPEAGGALPRFRQSNVDQSARSKKTQSWWPPPDSSHHWSLEHGDSDEDERPKTASSEQFPSAMRELMRTPSGQQKSASTNTSKANSPRSMTPLPTGQLTPSSRFAISDELSNASHDVSSYNSTRNPSVVSNMSSAFGFPAEPDPRDEEFSYMPSLTLDEARRLFRDTVLGLEYLHYHGVIHRDIKPANLLWSENRRAKISDFGVSYLGRPIRDNEYGGASAGEESETDPEVTDEAIELAKTVGTPAFYAPELCFTDVDDEEEDANGIIKPKQRPAVTGQIDVWALGVTLFCIVYARIPFMPSNEQTLFEAITKTEPFISKKRLRADMSNRQGADLLPTSQRSTAPVTPVSAIGPSGSTDALYEDVDEDLQDLIRTLLEKDPRDRITLREVKHHPWLLQGISDPMAWIERTDTAREAQGQKIQISEKDVKEALVPYNLVQKVKHGIQRGLRAITGRGGGNKDGGAHNGSTPGRRRAASSADPGETDRTRAGGPVPPLPSLDGKRQLPQHHSALSDTMTRDLEWQSVGGSTSESEAVHAQHQSHLVFGGPSLESINAIRSVGGAPNMARHASSTGAVSLQAGLPTQSSTPPPATTANTNSTTVTHHPQPTKGNVGTSGLLQRALSTSSGSARATAAAAARAAGHALVPGNSPLAKDSQHQMPGSQSGKKDPSGLHDPNGPPPPNTPDPAARK